jgi:hypothetical protein
LANQRELGEFVGDRNVLPGGVVADADVHGEPLGHVYAFPLFVCAPTVVLGDEHQPSAHRGGDVCGQGRDFGFESFGRQLSEHGASIRGGFENGDGVAHASIVVEGV